MEDSKPRADDDNDNDDDDQFIDASDEFPFYDCLDGDEFDRSVSTSPSASPSEIITDVSLAPQHSPVTVPPSGVRRRRWSHHIPKDSYGSYSRDSYPASSVSTDSISHEVEKSGITQNLKENENSIANSNSFQVGIGSDTDGHGDHEDTCTKSTVTSSNDDGANVSDLASSVSTNSKSHEGEKSGTTQNLKENEKSVENYNSLPVGISSERAGQGDHEEKTSTKSTVTSSNDDRANVKDLASHRTEEPSSNLLISLAALLIKAIGFQMSLLIKFVSFPFWLLYSSYKFVVDPFRVVRFARNCLLRKLLGLWGIVAGKITAVMSDWFKEHKSIWTLALRCACGLLWASYVCFVLVCLLVSAFVISGFVLRFLVEEPVQLKESLTFDYTKSSPEAFVRLTSCPNEKMSDYKNLGRPRNIPPNHKMQVTLSLTLPESDYNQNLGIFQVKVDFLSASGKALASSNRPCMLRFRSQTIRLLSTFLKAVPLLAGYSTEAQTLNVQFRGPFEGDSPTACLRVTIAQRAEFQSRAGIPEIYDASLTLESELPFLKRIIWHWKKTLFIWVGMTVFTTELLLTLLFCRPIVMPRGRLRGGPASNNAPLNNRPVQRLRGT